MKITVDWLNSAASIAVMTVFSQARKQAYFVGGCVRNALLGLPASDLDIATGAPPETVLKLARNAGLKAIPTGIEHGTITVIHGNTAFEITTFRRDVQTDGRRAVVAFADNITDDARRRDFTMNALYADARGQVFDPLDGLPDLLARRVRFIDDAAQRIAEDHLRILRFFRFFAWYGDPENGLDAEGLAACAAGADGIERLSKERIGAEMRKLLAAENPAPATAAMAQAGILARVLPGADPRALPVLVHLEQQLGLPARWQRRLLVLGGEDVPAHLRLSKAEEKSLTTGRKIIETGMAPAKAGYLFGQEVAQNALLASAALLSTEVDPQSIGEITRGAKAVFPVSARDLMPEFTGKALGDRLRQLQEAWFKSGLRANKRDLLD
jgi:poly(A) polymerase